MQERHEIYMARCLQLAQLGSSTTSPNPMVGSMIVHNGKIIGEGWHYQAGQAHAEVKAIASVQNQELLKKSTLYVNLEPCSHFGKTPPCSNLIIEKQIPKVVIGCGDTNSLVNGRGIDKLKAAGIEVLENVLKADCEFLNRKFFTFHSKKRPYILLKWAKSKDGFIDINRQAKQKGIHWISSPETRPFVHRERSQVDGILVGANTVVNDNPQLGISEFSTEKIPWRIIIDPQGKVKSNSQVFRDERFIYFSFKKRSVKTQLLNPEKTLQFMLTTLFEMNVQSIMVEGGAFTLSQFIKENLWDEALLISGSKNLVSGLKSPILKGEIREDFKLKADHIQRIFAL
jgi:diaminohydroxyphosphoribosylaminopyrimidine deaminase/5-amino-6-(5-phosphoribosylamino)uracil reductase